LERTGWAAPSPAPAAGPQLDARRLRLDAVADVGMPRTTAGGCSAATSPSCTQYRSKLGVNRKNRSPPPRLCGLPAWRARTRINSWSPFADRAHTETTAGPAIGSAATCSRVASFLFWGFLRCRATPWTVLDSSVVSGKASAVIDACQPAGLAEPGSRFTLGRPAELGRRRRSSGTTSQPWPPRENTAVSTSCGALPSRRRPTRGQRPLGGPRRSIP
jgi:hypothetical protein